MSNYAGRSYCRYCYCRIVRNKAADTARLSSRCAQSELSGVLPSASTSRPSGAQTAGMTLSEDEQAAAHLYALSLLQAGAAGGGAMSPLTVQQQAQAAVYAVGGASSSNSSAPSGVVFNLPTALVNRRTPAADDGECNYECYEPSSYNRQYNSKQGCKAELA